MGTDENNAFVVARLAQTSSLGIGLRPIGLVFISFALAKVVLTGPSWAALGRASGPPRPNREPSWYPLLQGSSHRRQAQLLATAGCRRLHHAGGTHATLGQRTQLRLGLLLRA